MLKWLYDITIRLLSNYLIKDNLPRYLVLKHCWGGCIGWKKSPSIASISSFWCKCCKWWNAAEWLPCSRAEVDDAPFIVPKWLCDENTTSPWRKRLTTELNSSQKWYFEAILNEIRYVKFCLDLPFHNNLLVHQH